MKTFTLFCLASLFVFSAHSQISKGAVLLGGTLGFSTSDNSNSTNEYKNQSYNFSPMFGFVVKENKVFGFYLSYSHGIYRTAIDQESKSNYYGVGLFHRSYLPLGKSFYLYGQGGLNVGFGKQEQTSASDFNKTTSNSFGISASPGVAYAVSKKFHLEIAMNNLLSLGYSSTTQHNSTAAYFKTSGVAFAVNANPASDLTLGFRILLGNK